MRPEQFQLIAKTVADPNRLEALRLIASRGEVSCSDIRDHLGVTAATISHHVKELSAAGLVHLRKEAKYLYLRLDRKVWNAYLRELSNCLPNR